MGRPVLLLGLVTLFAAACSDDAGAPLGQGGAGGEGAVATNESTSSSAGESSTTTSGTGGSAPSPATIVGSGFGERANPAPYFFQPFRTTLANQSATEAGYDDAEDTGGTGPVFVDMEDGVSGGSLRHDTGTGAIEGDIAEGFPHVYNALIPPADKTYRAFYMKVTRTAGEGTGGMQLKGVRQGAYPIYSGTPIYRSSIWLEASDGGWDGLNRGILDGDGVALMDGFVDEAPNPDWNAGGWNFVEVRVALDQEGVGGVYEYTINGNRLFIAEDFVARTDPAQKIEYVYLLPGFDFRAGTEWTVRFSNDYLDVTHARVVLTDSADYASSTKWALQPCLAWTDSAITIDPNNAGFASGSAGHYHVFDESGALVSSVEMTIP